ncbi:MAG TPA: hypothetical protein LFV92_02125 [Rickettsia endosymbiont of Ceroptres masudai]|nr:hypothetical protein [Rickettsia endosymbiont of Ceroptres masudai]
MDTVVKPRYDIECVSQSVPQCFFAMTLIFQNLTNKLSTDKRNTFKIELGIRPK